MSRISLWLGLLLLAALASVAFYADNRATRVQELEVSLGETQKALVQAEWSLKILRESAKVDEEIVNEREERKVQTQTKAEEVKVKVKKAEVRKNEGTITDVQYKSELIDSMWDSYCYANKSAVSCTTRQSAKGL